MHTICLKLFQFRIVLTLIAKYCILTLYFLHVANKHTSISPPHAPLYPISGFTISNKCWRIPKGQSKMDNPEKLAT